MNELNNLVISPFVREKLSTDLLPKMNEILQKEAKKFDTTAVIAGGSTRDTIFGVMPKDIDAFIDTSRMAPDEIEDTILLIGFETSSQMAKIFNNEVHVHKSLGEEYNKPIAEAGWCIYDNTYTDFFEDPNNTFDPGDGLDPIRYSYGTVLQFIGRPNETISSPSEFVNDFDYGLVKTWVDPETGEIKVSKDFVNEYTSREIVARDKKTWKRINSFRAKSRHFYEAFKIKKDFAESPFKNLHDSVSTDTSAYYGSAVAQNVPWVRNDGAGWIQVANVQAQAAQVDAIRLWEMRQEQFEHHENFPGLAEDQVRL